MERCLVPSRLGEGYVQGTSVQPIERPTVARWEMMSCRNGEEFRCTAVEAKTYAAAKVNNLHAENCESNVNNT